MSAGSWRRCRISSREISGILEDWEEPISSDDIDDKDNGKRSASNDTKSQFNYSSFQLHASSSVGAILVIAQWGREAGRIQDSPLHSISGLIQVKFAIIGKMTMVRRDDERPAKASLKIKAIAFISLLVLAVGASLSWYFLRQAREVLAAELQKRALSLTQNLAHNSKYGVLTEDTVILQQLIEGILQEESVLFVIITDAQGKVLAQGAKPSENAA